MPRPRLLVRTHAGRSAFDPCSAYMPADLDAHRNVTACLPAIAQIDMISTAAGARSCRNEGVVVTHIYARAGILTHALPALRVTAMEAIPLSS